MGNPREPFEPDTIYHVYNHGNGDELIFREDENYRFFLQRFRTYITPVARIYAYCLMPNHFHFMLRIKQEEELLQIIEEIDAGKTRERSAMSLKDIADLRHDTDPAPDFSDFVSRQFKNFLISYSKSFNKMYDRKGSLFLDNIKRIQVNHDDYFTNMVRYIHFNPVIHRFTGNLFDWTFSSVHAYYSKNRSLISKNEVLDWFGGINGFKHFHQTIQEEEFDKIKHLTIE